MKYYRISKKKHVKNLVFIAVFIVFGFILDYCLFHNNEYITWWIRLTVDFLMFSFPAFLSYAEISLFFTYIGFEKDFFEYKILFRKPFKVSAKNLKYYALSSLFTVYYYKDDDENKDTDERQLYFLKIPQLMSFDDAQKILDWFSENVEEAIDGQKLKEVQDIIAKYSENQFQKVSQTKDKAEFAAKLLNCISIGLCIWGLFYGKASVIFSFASIIFPFFVLLCVKMSNGFLKIERADYSMYPTAVLSFLIGIFTAGTPILRGIGFLNVDFPMILKYSFVVFLLMLVTYIFCTYGELNFKTAKGYIVLFLYSIFMFIYGFNAVINFNYNFSHPQQSEVYTEELKNGIHIYHTYKGALGIRYYYENQKELIP